MPNRFQTSQVLDSPNTRFVIDCGEGMQMQMQKLHIKPNRIKAVFISHLHADHHLGLLGLLTTMHLHKREEELLIFAPRGLDELIRLTLKLSHTKLHYPLTFKAIPPQPQEILYEDAHLCVETILMKHSLPCTGFLFKEKPKKRKVLMDSLPEDVPLEYILKLKNGENIYDAQGEILYNYLHCTQEAPSHVFAHCADTAYTEQFLAQIQGVDLLYHEATFMQADAQKAQETCHSTTLQAATIAQKAGVKKLVIGHFSNRYKDLQPLLQEAKTIFEHTFLGIEGARFSTDF
jgi:ribonuclease Z